MSLSTTRSTNRISKLVGILFLLSLIIPTFNWIFFLSSFISPGGNIAIEIQNNEFLFRLAVFIEVVTSIIVLVLAYNLHLLLKSVNENVSFLAFTFRAVEAILTLALALGHFIGLLTMKVAVGESQVFIEVLVRKYITLTSFLGILMGISMLLCSYLFLKSGYISSKTAVFGIVAYALVIAYDSATILFPEFASISFVQLVGGLPICLFLLIVSFTLLTKDMNFTHKKQ